MVARPATGERAIVSLKTGESGNRRRLFRERSGAEVGREEGPGEAGEMIAADKLRTRRQEHERTVWDQT
jgi:hypothetical protein